MKLSEIPSIVSCRFVRIVTDLVLRDLKTDSRNCVDGDLFVAIKGVSFDGHQYISEAIQRGVAGVVIQDLDLMETIPSSTAVFVVSSTSASWSLLTQAYFEYPASKLQLIAITGTSGKTTVAHILSQMLQLLGEKTIVIGTGGILIDGSPCDYTLEGAVTTPDPKELNRLLQMAVKKGCQFALLEASSHGLIQNRLFGLSFDAIALVSLSECHHTAYHKGILPYIHAKEMLFQMMKPDGIAFVNADSELISSLSLPKDERIHTISMKANADYSLTKSSLSSNTLRYTFCLQKGKWNEQLTFSLPGAFQGYNFAIAYLMGVHFGFPRLQILDSFKKVHPIEGRWQCLATTLPITVVVDKANTLLALDYVCKEIENRQSTKKILVFGNVGGGEEDYRAKLGKFFAAFFDTIFLTLDDPETEDPKKGIEHFMKGLTFDEQKKVILVMDRRQAIQNAIDSATPGSIVAILGRGNQKEFLIQNKITLFNDIEETEVILRKRESNSV